MDNLKLTVAASIGAVATYFEQYYFILMLVCIVITFDFVTGVVASKITGEAISSRRGTIGFFKKVLLLLALFFGVFLDAAIPNCLDSILGVTLPFNTPFGLTMGAYIIFNESVSISENFKRGGFKLPTWLDNLITTSKDKVDKGE